MSIEEVRESASTFRPDLNAAENTNRVKTPRELKLEKLLKMACDWWDTNSTAIISDFEKRDRQECQKVIEGRDD